MERPRWKQALLEAPNLVALTGMLATSMALLNPLPLILAAMGEAAYLLFVPDSRWYHARLQKRYDDEVKSRLETLEKQSMKSMLRETQQDWLRLKGIRSDLEKRSPEEDEWIRKVLRQLDYLMEKYLLFAVKEGEFQESLSTRFKELNLPFHDSQGTPCWMKEEILSRARVHYEQVLEGLHQEQDREDNPSTKQILQRRIGLLEARKEAIPKLAGTLRNITQQLNLIEDTFGYISDEMRSRTPNQVLTDIEAVVAEADTMTQTLNSMAELNLT